MNLVFSTTACPDALLPEALNLAKASGFERIELFRTWTQSTPLHQDTSVRMVRERLDAAGVELTGLNIRNLTGRKADSDERNLQYNRRQVEWDIHLARALRLESANLKGGARTEEATADLIEGVNSLLDSVPEFTLNLGNHKGNRLEGRADFEAVMSHLDERAKILLDTGHLLTAGEDILGFAEAFSTRIGLVHLRDQQGERPVPFGEGDLPFEGLISILSQAGYDGNLVVELEQVTWDTPADAARNARNFVADLLP